MLAAASRLELEGELCGVLARVELAELLSLARQALERCQPLRPLTRDRIAHRPGPRCDVDCRGGEEAAAGKDPALDV